MLPGLEPGTCIGSYRLLDVLGQGGFGLAYLAEDTVLQCRVVLKEAIPDCPCCRDTRTGQLRPLRETDREAFEMASSSLLREAQRMAALQHPGLIPVREVFSSNGSVFLVMPYLPGGSLAQRIDGELQPEQVRRWLVELLETLSYLHDKGLLHRDIKPENILFNESGHPVLIDLGSLRPCGSRVTMDGGFTLDYAAPELLARLSPPGPPADLYSLAATFRELLCGIAPPGALARAIEDTMRPLTANPERTSIWGQAFLHAIDRNLALNPAQRMQRAEEWLALLRAAAEPSASPAVAAPRRRRPALAAAAVSGLILATAALLWSSGSAPTAPDPAPGSPSRMQDRSYDELRAAALQYYDMPGLEAEYKAICEQMERDVAKAKQEVEACSSISDEKKCRRRCEAIQKRIELRAQALIDGIWKRSAEMCRRVRNDEHFEALNPRSDMERNLLQSMRKDLEETFQTFFTDKGGCILSDQLNFDQAYTNEVMKQYERFSNRTESL